MSEKTPAQSAPVTIQIIANILAGDAPALTAETWDSVAITAIVVGLAPLLHWQIEQQQLAAPPLALAKLAVTRQAHAQRNQAIAGQLAEILAACHRQHIPGIVLKGAILAPLVYPEPALRPMNDIDLLFMPDDLPRVAALLQELGYHGKTKAADHGPGITKHLSTFRRAGGDGATPNPYLSAAADRTVEPHGSLEEAWFGLTVDITPGVWPRAIATELHGQPASRLSAADTLLHLTVHAAFHVIMGASILVQLYDIGRVLSVWRDELDWGQVIDLSRRARAEPYVVAGLTWAAKIYGTPVPPGPLAELKLACAPALLHYIDHLTADALFQRSQQPPLTSLAGRLRRGLADRREAARWAGSLAGKWRVWQTALAVHKTDTASLLLGRALKTET